MRCFSFTSSTNGVTPSPQFAAEAAAAAAALDEIILKIRSTFCKHRPLPSGAGGVQSFILFPLLLSPPQSGLHPKRRSAPLEDDISSGGGYWSGFHFFYLCKQKNTSPTDDEDCAITNDERCCCCCWALELVLKKKIVAQSVVTVPEPEELF